MGSFGSVGRQQVYNPADPGGRHSAFYKQVPVDIRTLYYPHLECVHYANAVRGYSSYLKVNPNTSISGVAQCAKGYQLTLQEIKWGCMRYCPDYVSCPRNHYAQSGKVPEDGSPLDYAAAGWKKLDGAFNSYYEQGILCNPGYRSLVIVNPHSPANCNDEKIYTVSVPLGGNIVGRHDILNVSTEKFFTLSEIERLSVQYDVVWFQPVGNEFDIRNRFVIYKAVGCYKKVYTGDAYEHFALGETYPAGFPLVHPNPNDCNLTERLKPKDWAGVDTYKFADNFRLDYLILYDRDASIPEGNGDKIKIYLSLISGTKSDIPADCPFEVYSGMCGWIPGSDIVTEKWYPLYPNSLGLQENRVLERGTDYIADPISRTVSVSDSYQSDREESSRSYRRIEHHLLTAEDVSNQYVLLDTKAVESPVQGDVTKNNIEVAAELWSWSSGEPRKIMVLDATIELDDKITVVYKACHTRCVELSVLPVVAENRVTEQLYQEPVKVLREANLLRLGELVEDSIDYVWCRDEVQTVYTCPGYSQCQPSALHTAAYYRVGGEGEGVEADTGYKQSFNAQGSFKESHKASVRCIPVQKILTLKQYQGSFVKVFARGIAYADPAHCKRYVYSAPELSEDTFETCWHGVVQDIPVGNPQVPVEQDLTGVSINLSARPAYARSGRARCMNQIGASAGSCLLANMRGGQCAMGISSNCICRLPVGEPNETVCDEINQDYLQRYISSGLQLCNYPGKFNRHLIRSFTREEDPEQCPCIGSYVDAWQDPEEELVYYVNGEPAEVPAGSQIVGRAGKVGSCPPAYCDTTIPGGTNLIIGGLMCYGSGFDFGVIEKWTDIHTDYTPLYKTAITVGQSVPFELDITAQMNELLDNLDIYSEFGIIFESDFGIQHKFNGAWGYNDPFFIPSIGIDIPFIGTIEKMGVTVSGLELIIVIRVPNSVIERGVQETPCPALS